jgi:hypothetical protein
MGEALMSESQAPQPFRPFPVSKDGPLVKIIHALDRCEHGRHHADNCFSCPGGQSTGNLFLQPGQRIGTTLYGEAIIVPEDSQMRLMAPYWLPADSPSRANGQGPV